MYPILFIYVLKTFEHQVQDFIASQKLELFLRWLRYKHVFGTTRATNEQMQNWAPLLTYKKQLLR